MRPLAPAFLVIVLALAAGCSSAQPNKSRPSGIEETGGDGAGGSPATGGSPGTGGSSGASGGSSTGGTVGTGGSGAPTPVDASSPPPADSGPDAPASTSADGGRDTGALRAWIEPCAADWTRAQCCMHYCACMMKNCAERLPATCVETCSAPGNNWNLKCRVEQCFESTNPGNQKDRGSHCGHAVEKPLKCQGLIP